MPDPGKPILLSAHALDYRARRGFTSEEVVAAIRSAAAWENAGHGRLECRMEFPFGREWNGRVFATKQIRPIFVDEADAIVVVTVYTYYY